MKKWNSFFLNCRVFQLMKRSDDQHHCNFRYPQGNDKRNQSLRNWKLPMENHLRHCRTFEHVHYVPMERSASEQHEHWQQKKQTSHKGHEQLLVRTLMRLKRRLTWRYVPGYADTMHTKQMRFIDSRRPCSNCCYLFETIWQS